MQEGQLDPGGADAGTADGSVGAPSRSLVLVILGMAQFINAYDTTSMNVALSNIVQDLGTTITGIQSAITMYALVMAAFMITGGKLADIWGRKRAFRLGIFLYGLGAGTTALAPNIWVMLFGWSLLEGLGSGLMIPAVYTLIMANFPAGKSRVAAIGTVSAMLAMGAGMGPIIVGFLATFLTWRISFAGEVVVVLIVLSLSRKHLSDSKLSGPVPHLDITGAILSAAGMALVVFGVLQASNYGWTSARKPFSVAGHRLIDEGGISPVIYFVVAGLAVLGIFLLWTHSRERRGKEPLIHLAIFKVRTLTAGLIVLVALLFMQAGVLFVVPVYLQTSLEYTALQTGLTVIPLTFILLVVSRAAGKLSQRFAPGRLIQAGFVLMMAGAAIMAAGIIPHKSGLEFAPALMLMGIGLGLSTPPVNNLVLSTVGPDYQSEASGLSRSLQNLGSSLGTAVAGAIIVAGIIASVHSQVAASTVLTPDLKETVNTVAENDARAVSQAQVTQLVAGVPQPQAGEIVTINDKARDTGLRNAAIVVGSLGTIGLISTLLLPASVRKRRREQGQPEGTG